MFAAAEKIVHSEACVWALISVSCQVAELFVLRPVLRIGVEFVHFPPSVPMAPQPVKVQEPIRFGEDFELDLTARRLSRGDRVLKVERIPLEIMVLLIERWGETVPRDEIVARVWGEGAFLDTDNSIRGAVRKIRQVLKDDPEQPRFIQTITGSGYRFIAPLLGAQEKKVAAGPPGEEVRRVEAPMQVEPEHRAGIPRARGIVLAVAAGLVLLAITYAIFLHRPTDATAPKIKSIVVLPMKNLSGDSAQEYLADGMTEEIIGRLSPIHDLRVISRTSAMHFKDSRLSVPEIAKALNVDAVVEGSVIREHSRIRVHAQLIRAATDEHLWSESYDRELRDLLALESDVAEAIVQKVDVSISGQERSRVVMARDISPEVYESYLRGQFALDKGNRPDVEQSIRYFEQAINTEPKFAPAYIGLANAYDTLGLVFVGAHPRQTRAKVIIAAQKALELDPQLADAHVLLADAYRKQWKWTEAEAEYKRALELSPNNAAAHAGFADWLLCKGRAAEAVEWAKRARELDPLILGTNLSWILFQARRYDDAARELHATLAVTPDDPVGLWFLGFVLDAEGKSADAIPVLEKAVFVSHGSPGAKGVLVRAYANAGQRKDALRVLDELRRQRQIEYVPAGALVQAYVGLGDKEQALAWLEQAYEEQSNLLQWIKTEPTFDTLRGDPRFTKLVHRVGLD
jgi:TolB-like protein/DNA-binding winged helix-turn-helix (wHTH) protein/Flp pilus assembly protein TadD